ncbi:MAG: hypothetical protein SVX43_23595, partial [Cyanobacteriota bacterium]|nr:hypothetical protein [Cyanobacteriota bacterium]
TIWRYLCIARSRGVEAAQKTLLPVRNDPRRVMRQAYELFAGKGSLDRVLEVGNREGQRGRFYSHLYAGLYCEASDDARSLSYLLAAASRYPIDDYMWDLARVHCQLRGWE